MTITADHQKLEPGNLIRLFEVDGSAFGVDPLRFHSHPMPYSEAEITAAGNDASKLPGKPIFWQGQRYDAWPCKIEDMESNGDGTASSPKLVVANIDGSIASLCLMYQDMKQAKVTIRETYAHYLDAATRQPTRTRKPLTCGTSTANRWPTMRRCSFACHRPWMSPGKNCRRGR